MSTNPNIMNPTEASAVVDDDGASALAGADLGRAYSNGMSAQDIQESIWASATIESFGTITDDGWQPDLELSISDWAEQMSRWSGLVPDDAMFRITRALVDSQCQRDHPAMIGTVSLDLNPVVRNRPQDLGHPSAPKLVFLAISQASPLYDAESRRAMAVWYQPEVDEHGDAVSPNIGRNGRAYTNDKWLPGYLGIVDFYSGLHAAHEAMEELRQAVKVAATSPEDERDAFWEDEGVDENGDPIESEDQVKRRFVKRNAPAF